MTRASQELSVAMEEAAQHVAEVGSQMAILGTELKELQNDIGSHHEWADGRSEAMKKRFAVISAHEQALDASVNKSREALEAVQDHMVEAARSVVRSLNEQ